MAKQQLKEVQKGMYRERGRRASRSSGSEILSEKLQLQRQRLEAILIASKDHLAKALRIARGFERQKLGRRQKEARQRSAVADLRRLEEEVAKLKGLDLLVTAELYLYRTLSRIKSIASTPAFSLLAPPRTNGSAQSADTTYVTVTSRLFKSRPVRVTLEGVLGQVRKVLVIPKTAESKSSRREGSTGSSDGGREPLAGSSNDLVMREADSSSNEEPAKAGDSVVELDVANHTELDHDRREISDSSSPELVLSPQGPNHSQELEEDFSDDEDAEHDGRRLDAAREKGNNTKPNSRLNKTIFLPSLSMGGYWSGSDSAQDSTDEEAAKSKTRRNRLGQQARRALWEKRYGAKAHHVKKQLQNTRDGWDARRGAQTTGHGDKRRRRDRRDRVVGKSGIAFASGANSAPIATKQGKEKSKLGTSHPSWEAAKKRKEQSKGMVFEGKKLKFSE